MEWRLLLCVCVAIVSGEETRNVHSPCKLLINEFSPVDQPFLEIGKFCANAKTNEHTGLSGYVTLLVDIEDLSVKFFKNLDRKKLVAVGNEDSSAGPIPQGLPIPIVTQSLRGTSEIKGREVSRGSATILLPLDPSPTATIEGPTNDRVVPKYVVGTESKGTRTGIQTSKSGTPQDSTAGSSKGAADAAKSFNAKSVPVQAVSSHSDTGHSHPSQTSQGIPGILSSRTVSKGDSSKGDVSKALAPSKDRPPTAQTGIPVQTPARKQEPASDALNNKRVSSADPNSRPPPSKMKKRQRRSVPNHQRNLHSLYVIDIPATSIDVKKTYAAILLYLPLNKRTAAWDRYDIGKVLTPESQAEIQRHAQDILIVSGGDTEYNLTNALNLLPDEADLDFVEMMEGIADYAFAKCDTAVMSFSVDGFIQDQPSKGKPNPCSCYREPHPFSFKAKPLRSQSQQLIVNVVTNLRRKQKDEQWQRLNPVDAASSLLNLHQQTIYRVMSRFNRGLEFSDSKKRCRKRPVTQLDAKRQKYLYDIITGYYKRNTVPRFAAVLRNFVARVRLDQLEELQLMTADRNSPGQANSILRQTENTAVCPALIQPSSDASANEEAISEQTPSETGSGVSSVQERSGVSAEHAKLSNSSPSLTSTAVLASAGSSSDKGSHSPSVSEASSSKQDSSSQHPAGTRPVSVDNNDSLSPGSAVSPPIDSYYSIDPDDIVDLDAEIPDPDLYHCSAWSFTKILDTYGYKYGKIRNRDAQIFRPANIKWRQKYLEAKKKYDDDPEWNVIYMDETWVDPHQRADRGWVLKKFETFTQRKDFAFDENKISRGSRLIIIAAGGEGGFIHEVTEVYPVPVKVKAKNRKDTATDCGTADDEDYHSNVNGNKFYEWMEKLFKVLGTKKSVIVMDNCPYHKVLAVPKKGDTKDTIRRWLHERKSEGYSITEDVGETSKLTKAELLAVVARLTNDEFGDPEIPRTRLQQLAKKHGHRILLIPPYNCDLNPIEYVWSDIKREVREKNDRQTVRHAMLLAKHELTSYTAQQWQKHVNHVKRIEIEYAEGDKVLLAADELNEDEASAGPITTEDLDSIQNELGEDFRDQDLD